MRLRHVVSGSFLRGQSRAGEKRTDTLYGTAENENRHTTRDGADQRSELEEENGAEEDPFGFDDGEQLTDEEDETALCYCTFQHQVKERVRARE